MVNTKYKLIRDNRIYEIPESEIEVCDTRDEIINFSIKEIMSILLDMQQHDCRCPEEYADIYEILNNMASVSLLSEELIDRIADERYEELGGYSKYLFKVRE